MPGRICVIRTHTRSGTYSAASACTWFYSVITAGHWTLATNMNSVAVDYLFQILVHKLMRRLSATSVHTPTCSYQADTGTHRHTINWINFIIRFYESQQFINILPVSLNGNCKYKGKYMCVCVCVGMCSYSQIILLVVVKQYLRTTSSTINK